MLEEVDEVIYSRRRSIKLVVQPGGKLIVRAPLRTSQKNIERFLQSERDWIERSREKMRKVPAAAAPYRFVEGEKIWYLGRQYPLQLLRHPGKSFGFHPDGYFWLETAKTGQGEALLVRFYREEMRQRTQTLAESYAQRWGLHFQGIRITSAKLRWGSCSSRGWLNFSYRLMMAPAGSIESVVVHELAHLRHPNHSREFWQFVAQMMPGFEKERLWLKQHGTTLPPI